MIEHTAWRGPSYEDGINGQRIAIVGYSHWGEVGEDTVEKTRECIAKVISGDYKNIQFFTQVRNYFCYEDRRAFWYHVLFFNFLPNLVGGPNDRYGHGREEQRALGRKRFVRLIREHRPDKVFIFTGRHWAFGENSERQQLGPDFPKFTWREYRGEGHSTKAFFLRHPQGASKELMRRVVKYILEEQKF
jgi:hypothetical protein